MKLKGFLKALTATVISASILLSTPNVANAVSGTWKEDTTGWWYSLSDGSYAQEKWLEINGHWYYFDSKGYMDFGGYRDGYWLEADGAYNSNYKGGKWVSNKTGKWYTDASGWYPVSQWLKIDGKWYYFDKSGYAVVSKWIDGCYLNKNGEWIEEKDVVDYSGTYVEPLSGRCTITVARIDKSLENYSIDVRWSSSAYEESIWHMTGQFNDKGTLTYTDGTKSTVTYQKDASSETNIVKKNITGSINITDGVMTWDDKYENIAKETIFKKSTDTTESEAKSEEKEKEKEKEAATTDYSGTYKEKEDKAAYMEIKKQDDGSYNISIYWPKDASSTSSTNTKTGTKEYTEWTLSGKFDEKGVLKYEDCYKVRAVYTSNTKKTETPLAKNLSGTMTIKDGTLVWVSDNDIFNSDPVFVKE
ncbi:MAG: hypothetical protein K6E10_06400 [Eubacterium sp.]|nr:hypothetical protein [Eubacterium sp.]